MGITLIKLEIYSLMVGEMRSENPEIVRGKLAEISVKAVYVLVVHCLKVGFRCILV